MKETFITTTPFDTAVLFLVFNRLEATKQVFNNIRKAKPSRLYIAADGPRHEKPGEIEKVQFVRNYILGHIDWHCDVKTLFRGKNMGCKYAVSEAINWFFEHEKMGIILEDDCVPSQSFFWFCEELLKKYENDERIWKISGYNLLDGQYNNGYSYLYCHFGFSWGWASWRRAWRHFDVEMKMWPQAKSDKITYTYPFLPQRNRIWEDCFYGLINTWDYQWDFAIACNSGLSIVPIYNMIRNIGFGGDATHTHCHDILRSNKIEKDIKFPLNHPPFIFYDAQYETRFLKTATRRHYFKSIIKIVMAKLMSRRMAKL